MMDIHLPRWVVTALEHRPVNQTSRLPSVTPVLLRAGARRALRCRLPGPPSAFMAQRVSEESEDPKQENYGKLVIYGRYVGNLWETSLLLM